MSLYHVSLLYNSASPQLTMQALVVLLELTTPIPSFNTDFVYFTQAADQLDF